MNILSYFVARLTGMVGLSTIPCIALLLIFFGSQVKSSAFDHRYSSGDTVPIYASKAYSYSNHRETYDYYNLPVCSQGTTFLNVFVILVWTHSEFSVLTNFLILPCCITDNMITDAKVHVDKMLDGNHLVLTPYKIEFLVDKHFELLCKKTLSKIDVSMFRSVIQKNYRVQLHHEDMQIWAYVGGVHMDHRDQIIKTEYFLFNHYDFEFVHRNGTVIDVFLQVDPYYMVNVTDDIEADVVFTYSVKWFDTQQSYYKGMEKYTNYSSVPQANDIFGYSIANSSFTILILIVCLLIFYIRVLRKDISRYACDVEEAEMAGNQEETGWKNIHGDVFRFPKHKSLFAAALGSGTQLFVVMVAIPALGVTDLFLLHRPTVFVYALAIVYALTFAISGYTSTSFYHQLEGTKWTKNILLTGGLYIGPLFLVFIVNNIAAVFYESTAALPLGDIIEFSLLWVFLALPLLILGMVIGKNNASDFQAPCRTAKCPKEVPQPRWYKRVLPQMALAGIFPFSIIFLQTIEILNVVWGYTIYTSYGFMLIMLFLLLIMTALVSIVMTYFQLAAENHEWWWRSFFYGGSTGLYVCGYSIYHSFHLLEMNGFMQMTFFFGYMACIGYGIFLALGTVGFYASLLFVRYLYGSIKCD
ncbi:putative nonaspanin (TM9SF) [Helianthus annuus]|nr:putative nonaspanin (TM9SF) [Helianthus annuus]KAJ0866076.1 putative nonaspanin (TM9SF) [Helianthus annuus]